MFQNEATVPLNETAHRFWVSRCTGRQLGRITIGIRLDSPANVRSVWAEKCALIGLSVDDGVELAGCKFNRRHKRLR